MHAARSVSSDVGIAASLEWGHHDRRGSPDPAVFLTGSLPSETVMAAWIMSFPSPLRETFGRGRRGVGRPSPIVRVVGRVATRRDKKRRWVATLPTFSYKTSTLKREPV